MTSPRSTEAIAAELESRARLLLAMTATPRCYDAELMREAAAALLRSTPREGQTFADALDPNAPWNRRHSMNLPDIEQVSAAVHAAWMDSKRAQGVTTRKSESGEELMAPYEALSDAAKELDRGTVRAVYAAIQKAAEAP
jgi:hypothetical protein